MHYPKQTLRWIWLAIIFCLPFTWLIWQQFNRDTIKPDSLFYLTDQENNILIHQINLAGIDMTWSVADDVPMIWADIIWSSSQSAGINLIQANQELIRLGVLMEKKYINHHMVLQFRCRANPNIIYQMIQVILSAIIDADSIQSVIVVGDLPASNLLPFQQLAKALADQKKSYQGTPAMILPKQQKDRHAGQLLNSNQTVINTLLAQKLDELNNHHEIANG